VKVLRRAVEAAGSREATLFCVVFMVLLLLMTAVIRIICIWVIR
jgi:hypothetical protein